jgi:hypothetical protein
MRRGLPAYRRKHMTNSDTIPKRTNTSQLVDLNIERIEGKRGDKKLPDGGARPRGIPTSTFWEFVDFVAHGDRDLAFGPFEGEVNEFSQVAASLTELHVTTQEPVLALASMHVHNVCPKSNGEIHVRLSIGWHANVLVRINFIIVN